MSTRGRPVMDEGLRITVGNDVYFQRSNSPRRRSQSPSGDLRNRLGPRPHSGQRIDEYDERAGEYIDRMPPQQYSSERWSGQPKQWSPGHQQYERPSSGNYSMEMGSRRMDPDRSHDSRPRYSGENQYYSQPARGRSPHQRYSRSPRGPSSLSPSRRLKHTPYDEAPRRRSPRMFMRSPSPRRNSRSRRRSSSGSSGSRSRSSSLRNSSHSRMKPTKATLGLAEDLLLTMYSSSRGAHGDEKAHGYLHSSLDNAPKHDKRKMYESREEFSQGYMKTSDGREDNALRGLTKVYDNSPPARKHYDAEPMDEEDRYLYGDGASETRAKRPYSPDRGRRNDDHGRLTSGRNRSPNSYQRGSKRLSPEPPKKPILKSSNRSMSPEPHTEAKDDGKNSTNVTPGGFDSKALKNVLKAIGFDFELSKQSLEKAAQGEPLASLVKVNEPQKDIQIKAVKNNNATSRSVKQDEIAASVVQASAPPPKPSVPAYQPTANASVAMPVYGTDFQLHAGQLQGAQYVTPQVLSSQPSGGVYIYQPQATGPPQLVYQQHPITSEALSLYSNAQQASASSNLKAVTKKEENKPSAKSNKTAEEEKRARKQRLKYLEIELQKLKRQQLQLVKKRQKQSGMGEQELLRQNSVLQAGVEKQIKEIRLAAEQAEEVESTSDSSDSDSDESEDDTPVYQFIDPGNHICRICNEKNNNLIEYLDHLHTKIHKKQMDPSDKPWMKKVVQKNKKKIPNAISVALKGAEFLMPVMSFYCKICKEHFTDEFKAEDHCFGKSHNQKYQKFCKDHPQYEKVRDVGHTITKTKKPKEEFAVKKEKQPDESHFREKHSNERVANKDSYNRTPKSFKSDTPPKRSPYETSQYDKPKERFKKEKSPPSRHSYGDSQYRRPTPDSEGRNKKGSTKRKYEDSPIDRYSVKEEKKATRHGGRWSPGYDDYDRHNSPYNAPSGRPSSRFSSGSSGKPQGLGFGKFTWKRSDKKDAEDEEPPRKSAFRDKPTTPKTPDENESKSKFTAKPPASKPQTFTPKGKMGLGGKVGNLAPSTQVRPSKTPPAKGVTKVAPPMNAVLSASNRTIASTKPARPLGIAKPGAEVKKTETAASPEQETKEEVKNTSETKLEPPPPGTEDIFVAPDDGNMSDASGISMELASDEED